MKQNKREFKTKLIQKETDLTGIWQHVAAEIIKGKRGGKKHNDANN